MCKELDVSRAAYYKWCNHKPSEQELDDIDLGNKIKEMHEKYHGILGYRRMTIFLNRKFDKNYSKKRVHRIMNILDIHSSIRRVRNCCTVSNKSDQKADNVLKRNFEASAPNEKWATDVTEFKVPNSKDKLYLSAFIDLYDRSIVSWVISNRNDNKLVFDTFNKAIETYPNAIPLLHSDRGYQYTSPSFKSLLQKQGMTQSMSRVACCIDNGPTEALWGIIKCEMYKLYDFDDEKSLIEAIEKYIHFYNYERYQERFDSKTPMEVRNEALRTEKPIIYPIAFNPRIAKYKANLALLSAKENPVSIMPTGL